MGSVIGVVDSFSIHGITKDLSRIRKAREFLTVTMKQGCTYINGGPCGELLLMTASICHQAEECRASHVHRMSAAAVIWLSGSGGPAGQQYHELSPPSHILGLKCSHQRCQSCLNLRVLQVAGQRVGQLAKWLAKSQGPVKKKKISFIKRSIGQSYENGLEFCPLSGQPHQFSRWHILSSHWP